LTRTYRILVTNRFEKDFKKLPKAVQERVSEILALVERNPFAFEVLSGEFRGLRKVRVGDYRLIYRIDSENESRVVRLLFVAHRRSVYR
jgi:mRNA interferase RelE/StbE